MRPANDFALDAMGSRSKIEIRSVIEMSCGVAFAVYLTNVVGLTDAQASSVMDQGAALEVSKYPDLR